MLKTQNSVCVNSSMLFNSWVIVNLIRKISYVSSLVHIFLRCTQQDVCSLILLLMLMRRTQQDVWSPFILINHLNCHNKNCALDFILKSFAFAFHFYSLLCAFVPLCHASSTPTPTSFWLSRTKLNRPLSDIWAAAICIVSSNLWVWLGTVYGETHLLNVFLCMITCFRAWFLYNLATLIF